jgi:hypothetical protein
MRPVIVWQPFFADAQEVLRRSLLEPVKSCFLGG